jgi:catechol 2,3-dioxygenase-like lactoylglutathione lyase family enzyme
MIAKLSHYVTPSLLVRDIGATVRFYEALGFRCTGAEPPGHPTWVRLVRDRITLHFYSDPPQGSLAAPALSGTLYFHPDDVAALATEWQGSVAFAWGPQIMPYGWHEFAIRDPDGYTLAFAEPAQSASS